MADADKGDLVTVTGALKVGGSQISDPDILFIGRSEQVYFYLTNFRTAVSKPEPTDADKPAADKQATK